MRLFRFLLLLSVIVALAYGAPSDDSKEPAKDPASTAVDKVESTKKADDRSVQVADPSWETWLSQNSWAILTGTAGVVFIFAGVSAAFYYFYYLTYYQNDAAYGNQNVPYSYAQYPYQYYQAAPQGRSIDSSWNFNWGQVIEMIQMAQETYQKFDYQNLECQKKALCELSQKHGDFGETGRKISNSFSIIDTLEGFPMPSIVLHYLKEYKEAVNQGRIANKDCGSVYPKCQFSIKETITKYQKKSIGKSQPK